MHPWFFPVKILLSMSSPSSAYRKRCCKDRPIWFIFSRSCNCLGTHHAYTFRNFKRSCVVLYTKQWEHPGVVATLSIVILLSARINSSTRCAIDSVAISTRRRGRASSATFERPSENFSISCQPLYTSNTSHSKQETFRYEYHLP
jgi:hypothetical protein